MPRESAPPRQALAGIAARVRRCRNCPLHRGRTHAVPGEGPPRARIFLLGEAPGREEDRRGRPFVGAAGRILDDALSAAKIPRARVFITNVVKCRPPGNRRPKPGEIEACRAYLLAQLAAVRPRVIVALGQTAVHSLLGPIPLARARRRPRTFGKTPVIPTYHPAAIRYDRTLFRRLVADLRKAKART